MPGVGLLGGPHDGVVWCLFACCSAYVLVEEQCSVLMFCVHCVGADGHRSVTAKTGICRHFAFGQGGIASQ